MALYHAVRCPARLEIEGAPYAKDELDKTRVAQLSPRVGDLRFGNPRLPQDPGAGQRHGARLGQGVIKEAG